MPEIRAKRIDAERNRDRILTAARAAFAEPGADVSMAEIARRAGVGMATLYRNFPGRRELLEALYADEVEEICSAVNTADGETPGAVLQAWLVRFVGYFLGKRRVAVDLLEDSGGDASIMSESRARITAAARPLLVAAQRSGEVRSDLTLEQILDLVVAISSIHGSADYVEPILAAALNGLRPEAPLATKRR
jgi:AcrR family transcriptional regulator